MKQQLISRLVVGALAAIAANSAFAGQIQASSVSIAREVITTDTQAVTSPSIAYRFNGDVDARLQVQTFQVQFTLGGDATWNTAGNIAHVSVTNGITAAALVNGTDFTVTTLALSADKKTLFATISVPVATGLVQQPIVAISQSAVVANNPTIVNLKKVVGDVAECDTAVKVLPVDVKHYVALSDPSALATDVTATADEHKRPAAANTTTLITFPTNLLVNVTKSGPDAKLRVAGGNVDFTGTADATPNAADANGVFQSFQGATLANLGSLTLKQNAQGYDSNLANQYMLNNATAPAGVKGIATAAVNNGQVEVSRFDVKVSASQGFVVGGAMFLSTNESCTAPIAGSNVAITSTNAAGPVTLTIPTAGINAAFGAAGTNPVHVCYNVAAATAVVPGSSFYVDSATLVKAAAGTDLNEQNNFCKGPLYALSGSVKIDVRNYASTARADGWLSVLRLINPSETRTVDVYGQYIHSNGLYGKWGKLATLAPRAVLNLTPDVVDAKLINAPAHSVTANNATTAVGTTGDAPRLRITSENSDTLRVQNYLYNPASKNFIEASGSQGVDFTGSADRAPSNEGQYQEQDAQKGLNGGN
ncbi:hypothetical protein [Chitinimonas sp.]|uniref:hypothetical protein n=1 Tax=Chitinimonas sp. TaxID=1934313 RepID=UPI002F92C429